MKRMLLLTVLALGACLPLAAQAVAQAASQSGDDASAIRAAMQAQAEAWNRGDTVRDLTFDANALARHAILWRGGAEARFARIEGLNAKWTTKVIDALSQAYTQPSPKPLSRAHLTLALALQNEKHSAEAVPHAREAVKLDPNMLEADYQLGLVLTQLGRGNDAKPFLDRAGKRIQGNPPEQALVEASIRSIIGLAYFGQGLYQDALPQLERACALYHRELPDPKKLGDALRQAIPAVSNERQGTT